MRKLARKVLPEAVIEALLPIWRPYWNVRYGRNLRDHSISRDRLLILGTIPKSGRNYTQFLFANYVKLLSGISDGPVIPDEMFKMFPNMWNRAYFKTGAFRSPTPDLQVLGLDDFAFDHMPYMSPYWNQSKVIHLYRNPLDYAVSWDYHAYEYRPSRVGTVSGLLATSKSGTLS